MGFERSVGLIGLLFAVACSGGEEPSQGTGGAPGAGGGKATEGKCAVAPNASAATVSFKNDVMPIFGGACAGSSCHSSATRPKAGLFLGPRCDTKDGVCTWPSQPNTENPSASQPITQADIDEVHRQLMLSSLTAPAVKRVAPNDPDSSFLVDKVANLQNDKSLTCTNQDPNVAGDGPCGNAMPIVAPPLCGNPPTANGQGRVDTIVNWIAQGAPNN